MNFNLKNLSLSNFRLGFSLLGFSNSQIAFAILTWSLLILRYGYRFGTGDQVELLPYTLFLSNHSLYPHDFFIQGLHASIPNERTVMATLLLPFVNQLEITCFVFQFLCTFFLVLGLERLARRFVRKKYLVWVVLLVALIPLNDFALGNVDLYSECFQASGLAVALVVWAINWFLERKFFQSSLLLSIATMIQLLEGLDVMMVLSAIMFLAALRKEVNWQKFVVFVTVYAFTAGVYLVFIFMQKNVAADITNQQVFDILFQFRHPHHFVFAAFPKAKMLVFFLFTLIALAFFSLRSRYVFQFMMIGLAGVIVYAFAVDGLHNIFIGNFQFYKITQWMKFLGVVAIAGFIEEFFKTKVNEIKPLRAETGPLGLVTLFCWVAIIGFNNLLPYKVPFQLFGLKQQDDMIAICTQIKENTPADAVFIQPFENTELKYYAQRSSYVEFKANVRNKAYLNEWARRVNEVFGVGSYMGIKGFALQKNADDFFYKIDAERAEQLKKEGVTHLLTGKDFKPGFGNLVLQNNTYAVYKL